MKLACDFAVSLKFILSDLKQTQNPDILEISIILEKSEEDSTFFFSSFSSKTYKQEMVELNFTDHFSTALLRKQLPIFSVTVKVILSNISFQSVILERFKIFLILYSAYVYLLNNVYLVFKFLSKNTLNKILLFLLFKSQ